MTRGYDEFLAGVFDHVGPGWVALILLAAAVATGLLWYWYPAWLRIRVPRPRFRMPRFRMPRFKMPRFRMPRFKMPRLHWPRLKWPRFKKRTRKQKKPKTGKPAPQIRTPEPPPVATAVLSQADRLAAEGRYAEAIRERLRESVAALTRSGVITPAPAWTAHEVATTASANRPAVSASLTGATEIFSEVWYGHRPAGPDQDALMRRLTAEVKAALEAPR